MKHGILNPKFVVRLGDLSTRSYFCSPNEIPRSGILHNSGLFMANLYY